MLHFRRTESLFMVAEIGTDTDKRSERQMEKWQIGVLVLLILVIVIILCVGQALLIKKRKRLEKQQSEAEQRMHAEEAYYDTLVEVNQGLRKVKHDLRKHMQVQDRMNQVGAVITAYTGNQLLDALLTGKQEEAQAAGQALEIDCGELPELKLKAREIVSLFANLLDNAREAGVVAGERSRTYLQIRMEAEILFIQVRNTKSDAICLDVNRMQTTKQDQVSHGFGVSIIREIVETYAGTIRMQDMGTEFLTEIRLPDILG